MAQIQGSLAQHHHLYSQVRPQIQTGDLLAWRITRSASFFDTILMLYQRLFKAKFSHVAVAVWIGNRLFAVEAVPKEVRLIPLSMLGHFYLIRANVDSAPHHFDLLGRRIGYKYSIFDLARALLKIKGKDSELFCSELALEYYESIGYLQEDIDEFDDRIPTPDDIVERVLAQSKSPIEYVRIDKGNLNEL